jgi:tetratricopeptide (TPR) repeat protein
MAKAMGDHDQLRAWCDAAEARFGTDVMITTLRAQSWSAQGRDAEALDLIDRALASAPAHGPLHNTRAHVAIRLGEAETAKAAAMAAAQLDPTDQTAWALLSVALRLLDDPRETWLTDYARHVRTVDLDGLDLPAVAAALTALHTTQQHPAEQSLRGGTQTRGLLFDRHDPEVVALRHSIERAVSATLADLGHDPKHPFLRRNSGRFVFAGSWSVRLRSEGFHVSHIHPGGWLSSACYIALPTEVGPDDAGALALAPRRVVTPREGMLVLFPSFMWHGTLPFASEDARLTVAFDAVDEQS